MSEETLPAKRPKVVEPRDKYEELLLKSFTTGDDFLNNHVFQNVPMKYVDFKKQ